MDRHGLADWSFAFNRHKTHLGLCRYDDRRIELSIHYVLANDEPSVRDTVLHEIAHALAGPAAGHGRLWKRWCERLGATPRSCGEATMPLGRWRGVCPSCGYVYSRHRRPAARAVYSCRDCGPRRGRLTFVCKP